MYVHSGSPRPLTRARRRTRSCSRTETPRTRKTFQARTHHPIPPGVPTLCLLEYSPIGLRFGEHVAAALLVRGGDELIRTTVRQARNRLRQRGERLIGPFGDLLFAFDFAFGHRPEVVGRAGRQAAGRLRDAFDRAAGRAARADRGAMRGEAPSAPGGRGHRRWWGRTGSSSSWGRRAGRSERAVRRRSRTPWPPSWRG